jgi:hypothetical protein
LIDKKWEITEELVVAENSEFSDEEDELTLLKSSILQNSYVAMNSHSQRCNSLKLSICNIPHLPVIRIHNYKCPICSFVYERVVACEAHVAQEHPNWKANLIG